MKTIGTFKAKTHLSSILEQVKSGIPYLVTKRGKPIAMIVPYVDDSKKSIPEIFKQFKTIRKMIGNRVDIREMIADDRKH